MRRRLNKIFIVCFVVLLSVVLISNYLFVRFDFTANGQFSLSQVSIDATKNNIQPVRIDVFCSRDMPINMKRMSEDFLFLLKEYRSHSNVPFEINTVKIETREDVMMAKSMKLFPTLIELPNGVREVFLGAQFKVGDKLSVLSSISDHVSLEYEITRLLKQANNEAKPHIGFVWNHGEIMTDEMKRFVDELGRLTSMNITMIDEVSLMQFRVVCILGPTQEFDSHEIEILRNYLKHGGRLLIALNHAGKIENLSSNRFRIDTGLEDMLEDFGLKVDNNLVIDNNCGRWTTSVKGTDSFLPSQQYKIKCPYFPNIINFSKHPITEGLGSVQMVYTSSMSQLKTTSSYIYQPLAQTSSISGSQQLPILFINLQQRWTRKDFSNPKQTVAVALKNEDDRSAIVAIANADFLKDEVAGSLGNDNVNFAVNCVEWLADNTGLIQLRGKYSKTPVMEQITHSTQRLVSIINVCVPILAVLFMLGILIIRRVRKRNVRLIHGRLD